MGIGYIALWGFGAKSGTGWMGDEVDTPQTVTTTRAPAVLKSLFWQNVSHYFLFHRQGNQGVFEGSHNVEADEIPLMNQGHVDSGGDDQRSGE